MSSDDDFEPAFGATADDARPFAPIEPSRPPHQPSIAATPFAWRDPTTIPKREWIYGRHLIRRFISTTVAPGGVGKSSLTIAEAVAIASGRDILEIPVFGGPHRVWLWNLEDPMDELDRRIMATCLRYQIEEHDIAERLFVDSGRQQPLCTATLGKSGVQILRPVSDALIAALIDRRIDVLIVDPFISSHQVPENDNGAIDAVAKEWGRVAEEADCAISLVHHTKKLGGVDATSESSRGAISLINAARDARAINRMSSDLAEQYGIENSRQYFRAMTDKGNLAPPPDESDWYRLIGFELGNGDSIGVVERWRPPDASAGSTLEDLRAVQEIVAEGDYRENMRANDWVGNVVAQVLDVDPSDPAAKKRIKTMLAAWFKSGALVVSEQKDENRNTRKYVRVGRWA